MSFIFGPCNQLSSSATQVYKVGISKVSLSNVFVSPKHKATVIVFCLSFFPSFFLSFFLSFFIPFFISFLLSFLLSFFFSFSLSFPYAEVVPCSNDTLVKCGEHSASCIADPLLPHIPICKCLKGFTLSKKNKCVGT